jgi:hypothetical protein
MFLLVSCDSPSEHSVIIDANKIEYEKIRIIGDMVEYENVRIGDVSNLQLICAGETEEPIRIVTINDTSKEKIAEVTEYLRVCGWKNIDDQGFLDIF